MKYTKSSQIFKADGRYDWMSCFSAPVSAIELNNCIRIYFTTRSVIDQKKHYRTYISYMDVDKDEPTKILSIGDHPLISAGSAGTFDEHGTMVADVIIRNGVYYMYYMGWQRSGTVPYINSLGLATSKDGIKFSKISDGPVIGVNKSVPLGIGNVSLLVEDELFHMWYTHYCPWIETSNGYRPNYDIRYAYSTDGIDWIFGKQCISPVSENEAIATPCVRKINGTYNMWYSYRPGIDASGKSGRYRIGYATSPDGQNWSRRDCEVQMDRESLMWDSEMQCYPDVLVVDGKLLLFYCGNNYGEDGFGYTVCPEFSV